MKRGSGNVFLLRKKKVGHKDFNVEVAGNKVELTVVPETNGTVVKKRRGLLVIQSRGKKFSAPDAIRIVREERNV